MSVMLRAVLLVAAVISVTWIIMRIRKSKVRLQDTLFWMGTGTIFLVMGLFPNVAYVTAKKLGFDAPSNFIFFLMICLLFEKVLTLSIIHSQLEDKFVTMASEMALRCKDLEDQVAQLKKERETGTEENAEA